MMDPRSAARALGGEVVGRGIVCPGPNHSRQDRSLSILFDASAPSGFTLHSHAGDDFGACRDHVRARLGMGAQIAQPVELPIKSDNDGLGPDAGAKLALALRIWREAQPATGSRVEAYLTRRGLSLPADAHNVIRYTAACPFAGSRTPAMIALVRNVVTDVPQAVHRTALTLEGQKAVVNGRDRLALGSIRGGAVKLTADAEVTYCLGAGEGLESVLSLRGLPEFGDTPVWALLNTAGVSGFMPLPGIESLWLAVDNDPGGEKAANTCAGRWRFAGKETFLVKAKERGADLNDVTREVRHG
jgi:putative DNA primase/helicase